MGQPKIGAKIVLDGEAEYRGALKNINVAQKEARSEMKLWNAEFKENQNSVDALTKKQEILSKQLETQRKKVSACEEVIRRNTEAEQKAAAKVEELQTAYNRAVSKMEEMKDSSDTAAGSLGDQAKEIEELKGKLELAQSGYEAISRRMTDYQTSLNYAQAEQRAMESELGRTEGYLREAEQAADGCAASIDRYGRETGDASEQTNVFGEVLKANVLSAAVTEGIKKLAEGISRIAEAAVDAGASFEASMSQVAATMGMTTEEIDNGSYAYTMLSDAAKECGKSTMFSASEAGEALNFLALAGYDAQKAAATLPKVLDLAAAGGLDLAYASDLVTDSMAALGMETGELDNYIDEMARTSQKSNTSVAQLGEATLVAAGTVSLTGQSLETMNAQLGVLANNGIKGAEGGTHLRNVLLSLSAPTAVAETALADLGVQVSDSRGNMRDLNDIMTDLNASMTGMASEEKTRMINRIFNKTDIAAVNALLKGTGKEFDSLISELKNCEGAASNMAATLNNNLKGKVTILQSALEGLGISAYEIFDEEMKRSVNSATGAVGRLQKSMDGGGLGVSMRRFSKSLGELVEGAVSFGEKALPVVIDGLAWILDHSELITAGISGITAATIYHGTVAPVISSVTAAWMTYKASNEGATVAQWMLNAAMNANPAGLLITAVVGLTAAFAAYSLVVKDSNSELAECNKETDRMIKSARELNEAAREDMTARAEAKSGMEAEAEVCRKLIGELDGLQNKTALSTKEEIRQQLVIDQLNESMPELNLAIDEQTGRLNMSTTELKANTDAWMKNAMAAAAQEDLEDISKRRFEAEKELFELEKQMAVQADNVAAAEENLREVSEQLIVINAMNGEGFFKASKTLMEAKEKHRELEEQIRETNETINALGEEYSNTCQFIADTSPINTAEMAVNQLQQAAGLLGSTMTDTSRKAQQAWAEMCTSLTDTITSQISLFDEFNQKTEISKEQLLNNMESQIEGVRNWSDNMAELAERGIDQGLLQKLSDMGPEGSGYVAAFVNMTDEELKKANVLFEESLSLPYDSAEKIADAYAEAGEMSGEGFEEGITGKSKEIDEAVKKVGKASVTALRQELMIRSPSRVTKQIGEYFDAGLKEGMQQGKPDVVNTVSGIVSSVISTARNGLRASLFHEIGTQVAEGLADGIVSGKSSVIRSVADMCTEAVAAAKKELDINSPSKKFAYMGDMSAKGYMEGWKSSSDGIINAVEDTMKDIASADSARAGRPADAPDRINYAELKAAVTEAVEKGMEKLQFNINADVNEQKIVDITVAANDDYRHRTGRSIYDE